jgi:two-component system NtrC family response regulator
MSPAAAFDRLLKGSRLIRENFSLIQRAAAGSSPILLTGEEGTERDLLARLIHLLSPRGRRPFLCFNRTGSRRDFVETIAGIGPRAGLMEQADDGTLFLDGIENLEPREQIFLKTLIEHSRAAGDPGRVRFILGADESLRRRAEEGAFSPGLYYAIAVLEIALSPLRERKEDIVPLSHYILAGEREGRRSAISLDAVPFLFNYDWPGNYRELKSILSRAAERARGNQIRADDLPEQIRFANYWLPSLALEN